MGRARTRRRGAYRVMNHLLVFGYGYSAAALGRQLLAQGWHITASARTPGKCAHLAAYGISAHVFDGAGPLDDAVYDGVTHLLSSVPPGANGDPVVRAHRDILARRAGQFQWAGYLSTTGVYGDRDGGWVDEASELLPTTRRGQRRVAAERQWLDLYRDAGLKVHLFRLGGIYGPGRNQLESVRAGTARRIVRSGQVFGRIHVDDIATTVMASMARPDPGAAYNVVDDVPAPPQDVIVHAAGLLGVEPPPEIAFDDAELSDMARSFYSENKRVRNDRIKADLGVILKYPDYKAGLAALLADMDNGT